MTIGENITDAISLARSVGDVCLVVAIIGCIFMLVASACVLSFPSEYPGGSIAQPPVTGRNRGARGRPARPWRQPQGIEPDQHHAARAPRHARALRQRYRGRTELSA